MNRRRSVRARCIHTRIRRQWRDCMGPVLRSKDQQTTDFECTLIVRFPICTEMIQKRTIRIPVNYHQPTWYSPNVLTMATACSHLAAQRTAAKRMWRLFLNQRLGGSMDIYTRCRLYCCCCYFCYSCTRILFFATKWIYQNGQLLWYIPMYNNMYVSLLHCRIYMRVSDLNRSLHKKHINIVT